MKKAITPEQRQKSLVQFFIEEKQRLAKRSGGRITGQQIAWAKAQALKRAMAII